MLSNCVRNSIIKTVTSNRLKMAKSHSERLPQNMLVATVSIYLAVSSNLSFITASNSASTSPLSPLVPTHFSSERIVPTSNQRASSAVDVQIKETTYRSSSQADGTSFNLSTDIASIENELHDLVDMPEDGFSESYILVTSRFPDFYIDSDDVFKPRPSTELAISTETMKLSPLETQPCCSDRILPNQADASNVGFQTEKTTADYRHIGTLQTSRMWNERKATSPEKKTSPETQRMKANETKNSVDVDWSSSPKTEVELAAIDRQADPIELALSKDLTSAVLRRRIPIEKSHSTVFNDHVGSDIIEEPHSTAFDDHVGSDVADARPIISQRQGGNIKSEIITETGGVSEDLSHLTTEIDDQYANSSDTPSQNSTSPASAFFTVDDPLAAALTGIVLGLICLMTVAGNALVLVAICGRTGQLRGTTTTHYFVASLAVADLLLGAAVLPFSAALETTGRWSFGQALCDVWAAVDVLCCTASILSLCAISLDRYIGVTQPLRHSTIVSERRAGGIVVAVWLLSVAISVAPLFGWKEPRHPDADPTVCEVTKQTGYVLFSVAGSFYIPLGVILVVYYRVYRAAARQSRFLATGIKTGEVDTSFGGMTSSSSTSGSASGLATGAVSGGGAITLRIHKGRVPSTVDGTDRPTSGISSRRESTANYAGNGSQHHNTAARPSTSGVPHVRVSLAGKIAKFKREKKAAKTLGIVVGVFVLCWFPFFFILPLEALCSSCNVPPTLFKVMFWLGYCNSMMNPIIYTCASRDFKQAFVRILRCRQQQPFIRRYCCCCCWRSRRASSSVIGSPRCVGNRYRPPSTSDITFSNLSSRRRAAAASATPASVSQSSPISPLSTAATTFHVTDNRCVRVGRSSTSTGCATIATGSGLRVHRSSTAGGRSADNVTRIWRSMATDSDVNAVEDDVGDVVGFKMNNMTSSGQSSDARQGSHRFSTALTSPASGRVIARWRTTSSDYHETVTDQSRSSGMSSTAVDLGADENTLSTLKDGRNCRQYRTTRMSFPSSFAVGAAASAIE